MALLGGKWEIRGVINDGEKGNWEVGTKEVNDGLKKRDRRLWGENWGQRRKGNLGSGGTLKITLKLYKYYKNLREAVGARRPVPPMPSP